MRLFYEPTAEHLESYSRHTMKVLFLDIDGVLNGHEKLPGSQYCGIRPDCVARLNHVLKETGAKIVVSSAWRYLILGGSMTLDGFGYLLTTHGLLSEPIGHTRRDVSETVTDRGRQCREWLDAHPGVTAFCAVDDMASDFAEHGIPLVQTVGTLGLTADDAGRLIEVLNGSRAEKEATRYPVPTASKEGIDP